VAKSVKTRLLATWIRELNYKTIIMHKEHQRQQSSRIRSSSSAAATTRVIFCPACPDQPLKAIFIPALATLTPVQCCARRMTEAQCNVHCSPLEYSRPVLSSQIKNVNAKASQPVATIRDPFAIPF
jgi:hypothetical protein